MIDPSAEYRLLASFIDDPDSMFNAWEGLFTDSRVGLFRAMKEAYLRYGEITHEGVEHTYNRPIPGEIDAARGSRAEPLIDRLAALERKRDLVHISNQLNTLITAPNPDVAEIQRVLTYEPNVRGLDSSLSTGISAFISDFNRKQSGKYQFVRTGLDILDHMLGGEWGRGALTIIMARPGGGKCFDGNVLKSDGTYAHISTIKAGDSVLTFDEQTHKIIAKRVIQQICTDVQKSYKVTLKNGMSVLVSDVHPFLTGRGWIPTTELRLTDLVATSMYTPTESKQRYDPYALRLIAYLIGDGYLADNQIRFSGKQQDVIEDVRLCVEHLGDRLIKCVGNNADWRINGGNVKSLIHSLGLNKLSDAKFVPSFVFTLCREQIAEFLGALYSTDGWLSLGADKKVEIGYSSTSLQLVKDVRHLLTYFGIPANIRSRQGWYYLPDRTKKVCKICYQVTIQNILYIRKFLEHIQVIGRPKSKELLLNIPNSGNGDSDRIPFDLLPNIKGQHKSRGDLGARRSRVLESEEYRHLAEGDVYWSQVRSVEKIEDRIMWDLEVEDSHNFIGDGVVIHNTALIGNSMLRMAQAGQGALFISIEMPKDRVVSRFVAGLAEINNRELRSGSSKENDKIDMAIERLSSLPIYIIHKTVITVEEIIHQIRVHKEKHNIDAVFVDYLQLIDRDAENDVAELGRIAQKLRDASEQYDVAVILLAQLNYDGNLFGSSKVQWIADNIFEIGGRKEDENNDELRIMDLVFKKNREGPLGSITIRYLPKYLTFLD